MAIELITGRAGKAHIGSEDDRAYHAYTNGEGRYILNGGTADIESANNVHIDPVEFLVDGAHVRVTGAGEDVAIENGVASYKRIDVIALHYTRTGNEDNYIESVEFAVVKGANVELGSEPQVPDMPKSGTILTGADDVYAPVYSLLIDGLTPKNLTTLLEEYALPITRGGTGASTAAAAQFNILKDMQTVDVAAIADDTMLLLKSKTASTLSGVVAAVAGSALWTYVKHKINGGAMTVPIAAGGTGQTTPAGAVAQMCGIGFGATKRITDCMHIDTVNPYSEINLPCIIGTENAATLSGSPVKNGAFYAQRTVYPIASEHDGYHFVVYLHEMWPEPWRVWSASWNKDSMRWDGWHQISTRMESKPQFAVDMQLMSLGGCMHLDNGTDLNNVKTPGTYCVTEHANAQTIGNRPNNYAFKLIVEYNAGNSFYVKQTFVDLYLNKYVRKTGNDGQWENWIQSPVSYTLTDGERMIPYNQVSKAVSLYVVNNSANFSDEDAIEIQEMFPDWQVGGNYEQGDILRYNGELYRVSQKVTGAQADHTPDKAVSLYKRIGEPTGGLFPWSQPQGAHDAYKKGDKVSHNGKTWVSTVDSNVWEPGVYGWEEVKG